MVRVGLAFFLAKPLDYIPSYHQGLVHYLAISYTWLNLQGPTFKIHCLDTLTCPIRTYQFILAQTASFYLQKTTHVETTSHPISSRLNKSPMFFEFGVWCVLCELWGLFKCLHKREPLIYNQNILWHISAEDILEHRNFIDSEKAKKKKIRNILHITNTQPPQTSK